MSAVPAPAEPAPVPVQGAAPHAPSLRQVLLRPFVLPFALLLGVGGLVAYGVRQNDAALKHVLEAQVRLQLITDMTNQVSVMENSQRGFVITAQDSYLDPFEDGMLAFQADTFALRDLSVTDLQRTNLGRVKAAVTRWNEVAAQPEIRARRDSLDRAAARVGNGVGGGLLNEARRVLAVMTTNETLRLNAAAEQSRVLLERVQWIAAGGLLLSVALLLLTAYRVTRTVSRTVLDLNAAAQAIAQGDYARRTPRMPVQELAQLGAQFDAMAGAVQDREAQLRATAEALQASNTHLERSNRELEQFAYVASHDLQEPLRTIGSYTELLARRYHGKLDDRADQYIAFTTSATLRMKTLIQDLLAYSRVRKAPRAAQDVNLGDLTRDIVADLSVQIKGSGAQVDVGPLPTVHSNPDLLRHALQNLIGNALKFQQPGVPPRVRVTAEREARRWVIHVQDNGIGIAPEYHERIFGVFQRLHGMDEYTGSGIGLAVTRSAAEQLGGDLWLDSTPGQGSTFHLALPLTPAPTGDHP
ncbi:sensor histidine kinase [Deinococcus soli (ex Cha et al. 2016)]|uniref:sensor histidine kinase n=1 Tax=Deinococcus soli (ex Cha et al. 2016) TaxID=1309411 RepID=UPI00166B97C9|nr:ATP-binding protein [Deinococcus soli (ex Cha et al. 2016)]GGB77781.1 sensor histidine kinase [Deinococcus soli (ex Cha et al. 2016)]